MSWTHVAGHVARDFDDVLVPASSQVAERDLARLGPWPLAQAVPFRAEYLAGFAAARYEVEPPVGLERAQQKMAPSSGGTSSATSAATSSAWGRSAPPTPT